MDFRMRWENFFSHGTEHARGVCVMINPNSLFQVESVEIDQDGAGS